MIFLLAIATGCTEQPNRPPPRSIVSQLSAWDRPPVVLIPFQRMNDAVKEWDPSWSVEACADFCQPGLLNRYGGRHKVLRLHSTGPDPLGPSRIRANLEIPEEASIVAIGVATNVDPPGHLLLKVFADGELLGEHKVTHPPGQPKWFDLSYSVREYRGKTIPVLVEAWPERWGYAAACYSHIRVLSVPGLP
jgi:hypothetical protein